MIIYHPAYDLNHCAFRFITLLSDIDEHQMEWETMQLLDFYYVFPHLLSDIRLPQNPVATKRTLKNIPIPYESLPNPQRLMFGLKALHNEAARALVAKGIVDKDSFLKNIIRLYAEKVPETLIDQINKNEKRNTLWYKLLVKVLAKYPINGKNGLKDRTQLMEFRYDTN
jgi:ABC-3C biological conflict system middle component